jgi:hypothetical protein
MAQKAELKYELLYEIEFTLDSISDVGKTTLGKRFYFSRNWWSIQRTKTQRKSFTYWYRLAC